jgi:hypothetical protein
VVPSGILTRLTSPPWFRLGRLDRTRLQLRTVDDRTVDDCACKEVTSESKNNDAQLDARARADALAVYHRIHGLNFTHRRRNNVMQGDRSAVCEHTWAACAYACANTTRSRTISAPDVPRMPACLVVQQSDVRSDSFQPACCQMRAKVWSSSVTASQPFGLTTQSRKQADSVELLTLCWRINDNIATSIT